MLRRKGETQHHEENVEQAHPADVIERLEGQTAAVIIGVAACVVAYGWTKSMLEQVLTDIQKADPEWNVVLLRYFNPIGAHKSGDR